MTTTEILARVGERGICIISWEDFHKLFPGRCLTEDEMQFKIEFARAGGGKTYNPTGSSQYDKLMRFLDENKLSYRWIDGKPAFYRGHIDFSAYEAKQWKGATPTDDSTGPGPK